MQKLNTYLASERDSHHYAQNKKPPRKVVFCFGGAFGFKSESHHRGIRFGFTLHSVDNWVQALPAGGDEENQNSSVRYYICGHFSLTLAHAMAQFQSKL